MSFIKNRGNSALKARDKKPALEKKRTTSDCKIEIVARFDTDYFFLESFRKQ